MGEKAVGSYGYGGSRSKPYELIEGYIDAHIQHLSGNLGVLILDIMQPYPS
jgi:hypothetical protein